MANQKTILILHGWGSSKKSWEKVANLVSKKGFNVLVPDMPGFGDEPPPPRAWTGKDYLNWVLNFTKNLKLKTPFYVVGHSFGGGLAMKLAIEHPELVEKLVLIAAARIKRKKTLYKKFLGAVAKIGWPLSKIKILRKLFYRFIVRENDYLRTDGVMRDTFVNVIKEDLTPELSKIKPPTLIIWGNKDKMTPIKDANLLKDKILGSKLEIVEGGGHALNLEYPETLAEKIINFVK
ncbi:MAG: alpha/beta hydrolase [Candidatus Colwellbacteria bacterium]|nr:alpha/beta hydrolase [Candidatus Colwellbacteria bacterium]